MIEIDMQISMIKLHICNINIFAGCDVVIKDNIVNSMEQEKVQEVCT